MKDSVQPINNICDCLALFDCDEPFVINNLEVTEELTGNGNVAFNQLRELIIFLKDVSIIDSFNEDKLDELVNEKGF